MRHRCITVLLLTLLFLTTGRTNSFCQNQHQTHLCLRNIRLSAFLDTLSACFDVHFSYRGAAIPADSLISICGTFNDVEAVLFQVVDTFAIHVVRLDNQLIFKQKSSGESDLFRRIGGVVSDAQTNAVLSSVHVGLVNSLRGSITNVRGEFLLNLPLDDDTATIRISSIGYDPVFLRVPNADTILNISLMPVSIRLPEVRIVQAQSNDVISRFFASFEENYPHQPMVLSGFFRESLFLDRQLIQISEAEVDIYKDRYDNRDAYEQIRFVKGRKSRQPGAMSTLNFKMEGGPWHLSRIDVAKYWDFLPYAGQQTRYEYWFDGVDYDYGRILFRIGFKPQHDDGDLKYEGYIFFDGESAALVRCEFQLTRKSLVQSKRILVKKESKGLKSKLLSATYTISYKPIGHKWMISSVRGIIRVQVKSRDLRVSSEYTASSDLIVNDVVEEKRRVRMTEGFKATYHLYDRISEFDSDYWKNSNVILPDFK